jgi:peptide/nickel transport system permease protein
MTFQNSPEPPRNEPAPQPVRAGTLTGRPETASVLSAGETPEETGDPRKTETRNQTRGLSQGQIVRKRFLGNTAAIISLAAFLAIFLLSFSAMGYAGVPGWWQYTHTQVLPLINGGAPTFTNLFSWGDHPFGQDRVGRDMFAMTMRGTQQSIIVMFIIGALAGFVGVVVGALAGYFRGMTEAILMRFTDIVIIIPIIVLAAVLGRTASRLVGEGIGVIFLGIFIGLIAWTGMARLVRGEFLTLREREFVDAAKIAGASNSRIIFRHILPNAVGVIIVNTTLLMASAILLETALSFIGFGVQPPDVSLGLLISQNQEAFQTRPWLFWFPGLFIVAICLSINFIGDGLRDAFDPRQKKFNPKKARDTRRSTAA